MNRTECQLETHAHIDEVRTLLFSCIYELITRLKIHDSSKLAHPELDIFTEYTPKLKACVYDSEQYKIYLREMSVALKHHYDCNPHHPEHFNNGINGMTLIDLLEMVCDWSAAGKRHSDKIDIEKSIEVNQKRFGYSDELKQILLNTARFLNG